MDFISGPRMTSTPGKRAKGKTDSFTATCFISTSRGRSSSRSVLPTMHSAAILASSTPVALEMKGTVREARGFTSST